MAQPSAQPSTILRVAAAWGTTVLSVKSLLVGQSYILGEGVASPSLVGDKLYVFARQDGNEVLRCLNAADGKEVWQEKYESLGASGPAQGVQGTLSYSPSTGRYLDSVARIKRSARSSPAKIQRSALDEALARISVPRKRKKNLHSRQAGSWCMLESEST